MMDSPLDLQAPASVESEMAYLGGVLVNPDALHEYVLKPDDFFLLKHQHVFEVMTWLVEQRMPIDVMTVGERLDQLGRLELLGGYAYLTHLLNSTPSSVNAPFYARIIRAASARRKSMALADELKRIARDESREFEPAYNDLLERLAELYQEDGIEFLSLHEGIERQVETVDRYLTYPSERRQVGFPSRIPLVNAAIGGYKRKQLIAVGGRPGMGKSSWMLAEALHIAREIPVVYFSLEMGIEDLTARIMQIQSGIDVNRTLLERVPTKVEFNDYLAVAPSVQALKLLLEDVPALTPKKLIRRLRVLRATHGVRVVFIDYLQLMNPDPSKAQMSRQQEIGKITRALKQIAKQMDVVIIMGVQLSRAVDARSDHRPMLSDLREAGDIEQDTDLVMFPYRPAVYEGATDVTIEEAELVIAKQRMGKTGIYRVGWHKQFVSYVEVVTVEGNGHAPHRKR